MDEIKKIVGQLAKEMGMRPKNIEVIDGRYFLTDTFTTIIAADKSIGIKRWAEAHKVFVKPRWSSIKDGTFKPKTNYDKLMSQKMAKCLRQPEIDIVVDKSYGNVDVIAYTDDMDALVNEAEGF